MVLNKIDCPKIILLSCRQTKNQQDKLQIWFKRLTTKQSQIKTNKTTQIPKIFTFTVPLLLWFFLSALRLSHLKAQASFLRLSQLLYRLCTFALGFEIESFLHQGSSVPLHLSYMEAWWYTTPLASQLIRQQVGGFFFDVRLLGPCEKACRWRWERCEACLGCYEACLGRCEACRGRPKTLPSMPRSCQASLHILGSHNFQISKSHNFNPSLKIKEQVRGKTKTEN